MGSDYAGLLDGLTHPVLGIDHLVAMVCVGVVSAVIGKKAMWVIPSAFVAAMAVGGTLSLNGLAVPRAELLIAASLVVLGAMIALWGTPVTASRSSPLWIALASVVLFGAAHGSAHGAEIPSTADPTHFTLGFVLGTAALHLVGVLAGTIAVRLHWALVVLRLAGTFTAALGMGLLAR